MMTRRGLEDHCIHAFRRVVKLWCCPIKINIISPISHFLASLVIKYLMEFKCHKYHAEWSQHPAI